MPSENLTVDEQLMPWRSRCSFIQYVPTVPDKYGTEMWWVGVLYWQEAWYQLYSFQEENYDGIPRL